jgi:hypothetical protein
MAGLDPAITPLRQRREATVAIKPSESAAFLKKSCAKNFH